MSERSSQPSSRDRTRVAAVVVAGGDGQRMGEAAGGVRKQYATLLDEPILSWAVRPFLRHRGVDGVVVVLPEADAVAPPEWLRALGVTVVAGGSTRTASVMSGLRALPEDVDVVLIHDGARPFVSEGLIDRVIAHVELTGGLAAVVPATPATDTLKEVDDGEVIGTLDRTRIWHAQTPQAFPYLALMAAHADAAREGWAATDDAALFERRGGRVRIVQGDPENLKVTHPFDLEVARLIAARRRAWNAPPS